MSLEGQESYLACNFDVADRRGLIRSVDNPRDLAVVLLFDLGNHHVELSTVDNHRKNFLLVICCSDKSLLMKSTSHSDNSDGSCRDFDNSLVALRYCSVLAAVAADNLAVVCCQIDFVVDFRRDCFDNLNDLLHRDLWKII